MKNKKILVLSVIFIILIAAIILGVLYFTTDLLKSEQQLFYKYIAQIKMVDSNFMAQYNIANNRIAKNSNSSSTNLDIFMSIPNQETGISDVQKKLTVSSNGLKNTLLKQLYKDFTLSSNNQNFLTLKYIKDDNTYAIGADNILTKYLAVENANLKDLFTKFGIKDVSKIPDSIPTNYEDILKIDEEILAQLKETYGTLIYTNINKESFYKTKNSDNTETIGVSLTKQEISNLLKVILETAKNDIALLNLIITKAQLLNYNNITVENIQNEIQKCIDDLQTDSNTENGFETISNIVKLNAKPLKIELVKKDKDIIGLNFETTNIKESVDYNAVQDVGNLLNIAENSVEIIEENTIERIEIDVSKKNNLIIIFKENEVEQNNISINYLWDYNNVAFNIYAQNKNIGGNIRNFPENIQIQYQINNYQTETISQNLAADININSDEGYQISLVNNINLEQDVQISKLTTENSAKLNDMTSEEISQLLVALGNRINELYGESLNSLFLGSIIYQSTTETTENVTESMKDMNISVFNSKFTPYEGDSNGVQLKSLVSIVIQSNTTYPERKITINDMKNVDELQNYQEQIESSKIYNVKLEYNTSGFVNSITITQK